MSEEKRRLSKLSKVKKLIFCDFFSNRTSKQPIDQSSKRLCKKIIFCMTGESVDSPPRPVGAGVGEDDLDVLRYWPDLCVWRLLASEAPEPEPPLMLRERGEGDLRGPGGGPDRLGVTHGDAGLGLKILTPHGLLTCIGLDC